jgi:hypothetical protein
VSRQWDKTEWGWDRRHTHGWVAQVYTDQPQGWRVFRGPKLVAQGDDTITASKRRALLVLRALAPHTRKLGGT